MTAPTLAIDFGTSNSAAAILENGTVRHLPIEAEALTLPTAVFFPADEAEMLIGTAAAQALMAGDEGRYMRALKSVLGLPLLHETRLIGGKRRTLSSIITAFLGQIKARAEAQTGQPFTHALSGRPVHFHSNDPERDARAETDLRACYLAAGFETVDFLFEPEAAALTYQSRGAAGEIGLIVDIGGGTSDFTVFRSHGPRIEVLASHGIRLGGTDFDQAVSMAHVMAHLGHGGTLKRSFGTGLLPVPNAIYVDLSTWAKIPFLYTRDTERAVEDMVKHASDPRKMRRLEKVIEDHLGHTLAFAVERGKIEANGATASEIAMGFIEPRLNAPITPDSLNAALQGFRPDLRAAMAETLSLAGVDARQIDAVILVGGSSLMGMISQEAQALFPLATQDRADAFTAVVDGLARATALRG
ncbi:Hsp70 family protein [uncultured Thioclava sp.]|uniref:Hsp70 family protein n=1 Tax=uncultured Thioclava sp. TaxID=473858 RepID=UPI0025E1C254|nr:Hsp70 family protein [uncultured Thioclava sp.]